MRARTKSRIAFSMAAVLGIAAIVALVGLFWLSQRASETKPDPNNSTSNITLELPDEKKEQIKGVDWDYWRSVNPAIVGWLTVPGTAINSPIIHAPKDDPDYYLSHDVYGSYNPMGAIYLDCGSTGLFTGGNSVIFGHHWGNLMFASMARYSDRAWALDHRNILIFTPDGQNHVLSVQCADVIRGTDPIKRTSFKDQSDLNAYWHKRFDTSKMKLVDDASQTSQLFTFVTCSYNFWAENERTLTYAIENGEGR